MKQLFNNLSELKEIPYGYDYEVITDCNDSLLISYDKVNFILCTNPEVLEYEGEKFKEYTVWDLFLIVKELDPCVEISADGFINDCSLCV